MSEYLVVVTDDRYGKYKEEESVLQAIGARLQVMNCSSVEEVREATKSADGVIVNLAPIDCEVIENMDKCKVISRYGVGYDNVDVQAATEKGIYVANVPDYCAEDVSDHALALFLSAARSIPATDRAVRQGQWNVSQKSPLYRTEGKVFGLVGYGMIARVVHRKLGGFNLKKVLVFDPFVDAEVIHKAGGQKVELEQLCRESDYISVHAPLNESTRGILGREQFAIMKPGVLLINVARGPVVDEKALLEALSDRVIAGAALDVYETEPLPKEHPLRKKENVVLTDHGGWYTIESMAELKTKAAQNVASVLTGKAPPYPVNQPDVEEDEKSGSI